MMEEKFTSTAQTGQANRLSGGPPGELHLYVAQVGPGGPGSFPWAWCHVLVLTMKALTIEPRMACSSSSMVPTGHWSVMTRWP